VGRGVDEWVNYDISRHVLGADEDKGDVLVIKSGTDFRDISEITLELENTPEGSIRQKLISRVTGKRMPLWFSPGRPRSLHLSREATRN